MWFADLFTNAWELKRLGELCKGIGGVSLEKYFNPNGKYNVINIGSYGVDGEYNDQLLRINKNNISQNYLLNKDDLVMVLNDKTMEGNILGKVLYIDKSDKFIYNQRTQRLIIDETKYNSKYIYYLMYSKHTRYKILSIKQRTSQIYINWSEVEKLSLNITSNYKEQCFIHKLFENLKTNVLLLQRKLIFLKNDWKHLFDTN
ncbi:hypothetical protein EG856_00520 [Mycoplasmopsis phocirhinis]|uniref:Restriction endonuclease subunit S n=1 Tax=Mycoplasmopsis phocirhinis TaxID=142650 RepID=A0A4P6MNG4_9BACT|nr:restriction endonuclease subunit S [Mycoplasmopsis phocirhinis]QBF34420.1 hypothetical protein EG856_00520 [Mycoplasmopsis phocirhinis]